MLSCILSDLYYCGSQTCRSQHVHSEVVNSNSHHLQTHKQSLIHTHKHTQTHTHTHTCTHINMVAPHPPPWGSQVNNMTQTCTPHSPCTHNLTHTRSHGTYSSVTHVMFYISVTSVYAPASENCVPKKCYSSPSLCHFVTWGNLADSWIFCKRCKIGRSNGGLWTWQRC